MKVFIATTFGVDNVDSDWKAIDATLKGAHDHLEIVFVTDAQRWRLFVSQKPNVQAGLYEFVAKDSFLTNSWRFYALRASPEETQRLFDAALILPGTYDWIAAYQTVAPRFLRQWPWRLLFGDSPSDATYCARAVAKVLRAIDLCAELDDWPTSSDVIYSLRASDRLKLVDGLPTSSSPPPSSA